MKYIGLRLPDYYLTLLKSNLTTKGTFISDLTNYIYHYSSFHGLIIKYFKDIDEETRIDVILKSMGWENFRNRMATIFINYEKYGQYPEKLDNNVLNDVIKFENQVKGYTTEGNSRAFLLGFYKKMAEIRIKHEKLERIYVVPELEKNVFEILKMSSSKIIKIDIILLLLEEFLKNLEEKDIKNHIRKKLPFNDLYEKLNISDREVLVKNLLAYGHSINETDLFINDTV